MDKETDIESVATASSHSQSFNSHTSAASAAARLKRPSISPAITAQTIDASSSTPTIQLYNNKLLHPPSITPLNPLRARAMSSSGHSLNSKAIPQRRQQHLQRPQSELILQFPHQSHEASVGHTGSAVDNVDNTRSRSKTDPPFRSLGDILGSVSDSDPQLIHHMMATIAVSPNLSHLTNSHENIMHSSTSAPALLSAHDPTRLQSLRSQTLVDPASGTHASADSIHLRSNTNLSSNPRRPKGNMYSRSRSSVRVPSPNLSLRADTSALIPTITTTSVPRSSIIGRSRSSSRQNSGGKETALNPTVSHILDRLAIQANTLTSSSTVASGQPSEISAIRGVSKQTLARLDHMRDEISDRYRLIFSACTLSHTSVYAHSTHASDSTASILDSAAHAEKGYNPLKVIRWRRSKWKQAVLESTSPGFSNDQPTQSVMGVKQSSVTSNWLVTNDELAEYLVSSKFNNDSGNRGLMLVDDPETLELGNNLLMEFLSNTSPTAPLSASTYSAKPSFASRNNSIMLPSEPQSTHTSPARNSILHPPDITYPLASRPSGNGELPAVDILISTTKNSTDSLPIQPSPVLLESNLLAPSDCNTRPLSTASSSFTQPELLKIDSVTPWELQQPPSLAQQQIQPVTVAVQAKSDAGGKHSRVSSFRGVPDWLTSGLRSVGSSAHPLSGGVNASIEKHRRAESTSSQRLNAIMMDKPLDAPSPTTSAHGSSGRRLRRLGQPRAGQDMTANEGDAGGSIFDGLSLSSGSQNGTKRGGHRRYASLAGGNLNSKALEDGSAFKLEAWDVSKSAQSSSFNGRVLSDHQLRPAKLSQSMLIYSASKRLQPNVSLVKSRLHINKRPDLIRRLPMFKGEQLLIDKFQSVLEASKKDILSSKGFSQHIKELVKTQKELMESIRVMNPSYDSKPDVGKTTQSPLSVSILKLGTFESTLEACTRMRMYIQKNLSYAEHNRSQYLKMDIKLSSLQQRVERESLRLVTISSNHSGLVTEGMRHQANGNRYNKSATLHSSTSSSKPKAGMPTVNGSTPLDRTDVQVKKHHSSLLAAVRGSKSQDLSDESSDSCSNASDSQHFGVKDGIEYTQGSHRMNHHKGSLGGIGATGSNGSGIHLSWQTQLGYALFAYVLNILAFIFWGVYMLWRAVTMVFCCGWCNRNRHNNGPQTTGKTSSSTASTVPSANKKFNRNSARRASLTTSTPVKTPRIVESTPQ
ncbi:hypothetical protein QVD99_004509 [Batrachochytrium dendrobatidis]|nr:hypothetical protein QVD99_004509 [Batrachochytrium dendrobatidis]